jgi:hypothetical protein
MSITESQKLNFYDFVGNINGFLEKNILNFDILLKLRMKYQDLFNVFWKHNGCAEIE